MDLLEAWSAGGGGLAAQLPDTNYFDEAAFFQRAIAAPAALTYLELVQFAAFVAYLRHHRGAIQKGELHQWMRVIRNLAANSDIERPEEYGRSIAGLQQLVPEGNRILERLADGQIDVSGFSAQQVREEVLKARLILANDGWRQRIESAEGHHRRRGAPQAAGLQRTLRAGLAGEGRDRARASGAAVAGMGHGLFEPRAVMRA